MTWYWLAKGLHKHVFLQNGTDGKTVLAAAFASEGCWEGLSRVIVEPESREDIVFVGALRSG